MTDSLQIIGMMSGTSVDSIDAALCECNVRADGTIAADVVAFHEHAMPERLRARIFELFQNGAGSLSLACSLNFEIGEAFADAAEALLIAAGVARRDVAAIASHGQTAYHIAPHMTGGSDNPAYPSTMQIGEAAVIAERLGIPVIADFRVADMAAGGNGAPLVPFADFHLFSQPGRGIIVHNLGGIANCTWLPPSNQLSDVIAFDTGPGNMIIDGLVQRLYPGENYDANGAHAANGNVLEDLLKVWMQNPYLSAAPPKSTGRELFGLQFVEQVLVKNSAARADDLIATATAFTAESFVQNIVRFIIPRGTVDEVLLAGGGALNGHLVAEIRRKVEAGMSHSGHVSKVRLLDETGISSKARECVAFAVLGFARLRGIEANVPSATGARHPCLLGKLTHPFMQMEN